MFLIPMRRAKSAVASCCLLALPLACSAQGGPSSQITAQDVGGGAATPGTMVGAGGVGGVHIGPVESPTETSPPPTIMTDPNSVQAPSGCTKPQNILFLIDRSGSMQCNPP